MKLVKKSNLDKLLNSNVGMMLLLINLIGMLWYVVLINHPLPQGFSTVILGIWGSKTVHGVLVNHVKIGKN